MPARVDFPYFLETDAVVLGIGFLTKIELSHQRFTQVAAAALSENRVFAEQFVASLVTRLPLAIFA